MIYASTEVQRLLHSFYNGCELGGVALDATQKSAVRDLLVALNGIGLSKFTAIYPLVGGSAAAHSLDLLGAFDITWNGTVTHDSSGITGNGSTGYGDTGIVPVTHLSQDSVHLSAYLNQDPVTGTGIVFGVAGPGATQILAIAVARTDTNEFVRMNATDWSQSTSGTPPDGFFVGNRPDSANQNLWQNGVETISGVRASSGTTSGNLYLLARNNVGTDDGHTAIPVSFASVGAGLTDGELVTMNTAVQAYATALSRAA